MGKARFCFHLGQSFIEDLILVRCWVYNSFKSLLRIPPLLQRDGPSGEATCHQVGRPAFNSQVPYSKRAEPTPLNCPLAFVGLYKNPYGFTHLLLAIVVMVGNFPYVKNKQTTKQKLRYEVFFVSSASDFMSVIVREFGRLGSLIFKNLKHF